jgi:hypothetical protein
MRTPRIGDIVYYRHGLYGLCPALVNVVVPGDASRHRLHLTVFTHHNRTGILLVSNAPYHATAPACWFWPEEPECGAGV